MSKPRFGITKSRTGHYTAWCQHAKCTCNKISSAHRAAQALAAGKAAVGELTGRDACDA